MPPDNIISVDSSKTTSQPTSPPALPSAPKILDAVLQYGLQSAFLLLIILATTINKKFFQPWLKRGRVFVKRDARTDSEINSILHQMLGIADADRVVLGVFYNSKSKGSDDNNDRMLITNEAIRLGIASVRTQVREASMSKFMKDLMQLREVPEGTFRNVSVFDPGIDDSCKSYLLSIGVRYASSLLLSDSGKELGIISIHICARFRGRDDTPSFEDLKKLYDVDTVKKLIALSDLLSYTLSRPRPNMFDAMWDIVATPD